MMCHLMNKSLTVSGSLVEHTLRAKNYGFFWILQITILFIIVLSFNKWMKASIESDNSTVIKACHKEMNPWDIGNIVADLEDCCSNLNKVKFRKIDKNQNKVVHWVATTAARDASPDNLMISPPEDLVNLV